MNIAPAVDIVDRWETLDGKQEHIGYDVTVGGTRLPAPVLGFELIELDTPGQRAVSLTIPVGAVTVGGRPPVTTADGRAARTWGGRGQVDPRA